MQRMMGVVLGLLLIVMLGGCETVKGIGRDISEAGEAIEDAAR